MMLRNRTIFVTCLLITLFLFLPLDLALSADTTNIYDSISAQPIPGVPSGNFSNWSESDRSEVVKTVVKSCMFQCGMLFGSANYSAERAKEESQTCSAACIVKHLPNDYSDHEQLIAAAMGHYEAAKGLGSIFPAPTFPNH